MSQVITVIERKKVEAINCAHRAVEQSYGEAVTHAIDCGLMLEAVKADLTHGQWLPWLGEQFEGSTRTAQAYMQLAREVGGMGKAQATAHSTIEAALREISKPRSDKAGRGTSPRDAVGMVGALEDDEGDDRLLPDRIDAARARLQASAPAWTEQHERRGRKIDELLSDATALRVQATQSGLTKHAVAQLLRSAETKARQASGQLSELAFSFER